MSRPDRPGAVVFDLGNVLVRWDPYGPYEGRMDRDAVTAFFEELGFGEFNRRQDAGRSWASARAEVGERAPHLLPALDIYVDHFAASLLGPVDGMADLVAELRAAGVRLLGLTNWSAETFPPARTRYEFLSWFDGIVVSGEEGVIKPDARIFRILLERYGIAADEAVFIDDNPGNAAAAQALGIHGIHFRSPELLRRELETLGIL